MKVLVVDDVADAADSLADFLRLSGHDARTAADGGAALARMAEWRPDAVVLDLMLPRINGWEMLDSKAAMPDLAGVPVVVLSGYTALPHPLPAGQVREVLAKPADPAAVLAAVRRAVKGEG
jgi:CheY-like chemotaxis protein